MIKRETYMRRIRPFIGSELVKVMTGIRRCGKSVMLELIKEELKNNGVPEANIISINFEDMRYASLLTAKALHDEIIMRAQNISGISAARCTYFLMKYRKLQTGKNALTLSG